MTKEEVLKKFEELGWKYIKKPNNKILFERYNQEYGSYDFIFINKKTKTYINNSIDMKIHQLLTELFKCEGWFDES